MSWTIHVFTSCSISFFRSKTTTPSTEGNAHLALLDIFSERYIKICKSGCMMTHKDTNFEFCSDLIDVPFFEDVQEFIFQRWSPLPYSSDF